MRVKFSDLENAFAFASAGGPIETSAYLCRQTGTFYWHSDDSDDLDELPDDMENEARYLVIPGKHDLDLGNRLVFNLISEFASADYGRVRDIFLHRSAYARFKDLLETRDLLQTWYDYEADATVTALKEWCLENEIEVDDE